MSNMFDVLFQCVKDRFPKLNWKLGSVIRSLLIDPLEKISNEVDAYTDKLRAMTDLRELLDSPARREDELDNWMLQLGLSLPENKNATGQIALICDATDSFTVAAGTSFTWNEGVILLAAERVDVNENSLVSIGNDLYRILIPVVASGPYDIALDAGSPVAWGSAPDSVVDMFTYTPITGGVSEDSIQTKVALIKAALTQPAMCGADAIRSALIRKYGPSIVDVKLGRRLTDNAAATVPVYIKQAALPRIVEGEYVYHTVNEAIRWMNSEQCGSPFKLVGMLPTYASVSLQINTGGVDLSINALSAICEYINGSALDKALSDSELKSIISSYGYTVTGAILYTAAIDSGAVGTTTQAGGLHLTGKVTGSGAPVALYCTLDNIKTY